jgi:hypothetical protein
MGYELFKHLNYEKEPDTPNEFDALFCKIAEKMEPKSFKEMEGIVKEAFEGKYDKQVTEWGEKLKLDWNKLEDLFVRK